MDVAHRATFSGHRAGGKSGCAPWVPESRQATLAHSGKSVRLGLTWASDPTVLMLRSCLRSRGPSRSCG